jgi:hypothetical protein
MPTSNYDIKPGDAVTWNDRGVELFGSTNADGIVLNVGNGTAHILWSTDQETWASLSVLKVKGAADA